MATQSHSRALDTLEASIKTILLQIGSTFADPSNYDSGKLVRTTTQLKFSLPPALSGFHHALDELERDLMHARAVLHRDLVNDRTRQAAGGDQKVSQNVLTNGLNSGDVDMTNGSPPPVHSPAAVAILATDHVVSIANSDDVHKTKDTKPGIQQHSTEQNTNLPASNAPEPVATAATDSQKAQIPTPHTSPNQNDTTAATASQLPQSSFSSVDIKPTPIQTSNNNASNKQPSPDPEPTTAATNDDLFDNSIFGTPPSLNNTSNNNTGVNPTPADSSALSNIDVNSLLPGLEFYANDTGTGTPNNINNSTANMDPFASFANNSANGGADFFGNMGDMSFTNTNDNGMGMGAMGMGMDGQHQNLQMGGGGPSGDISFDDFFANMGSNDGGGAGMSGFASALPAGNEDTGFDESFFNLDP